MSVAAVRTGQAQATGVPTEGQLVEVRGSRWVVTDVQRQGLTRSPADEGIQSSQHAVALQSVEDDRLGHELKVVWELEPGRLLVPNKDLPDKIDADRFDDPETLAAFIDALRWGAVTSADAKQFQAPFRSAANVEAYQLDPLRRALESSRANLLLADDVGLGKTIEAGLVVQELLLRHRARTVLVVCPPSLCLKWQDEMEDKFGLRFEIINSESIVDVQKTYGPQANPFLLYPRAIVSMAWLSQPRAQRMLRNIYSEVKNPANARQFAFDILVVDEAHHVAPSSPSGKAGGGYAVDSLRTIAVRELAEACENRLFLSATPHNGYAESFTALLEMIDPRRFARGAALDQEALKAVAIRRRKDDLPEKGFKAREVKALPYEPSTDEADAYERLLEFTTRRDKAAKQRTGSSDLVTLLLKKRFFSSPLAFAMTAETFVSTNDWKFANQAAGYDETLGSEAADEEEGLLEHPEMQALEAARSGQRLSSEDRELLQELAEWGREYEGRANSRLDTVVEWLDGVCRTTGRNGTKLWTDERVVIFTEYVDTLNWVRDVLQSNGYTDGRLEVIEGSTDKEERELIRARFNAPPSEQPVRILLATDAAGEGIDLQEHCHRLINFDIPFNPTRLEQRIGRIDRYGQTHNPQVFHFTPTGESKALLSGDAAFLARIADKIARVRNDLGSANEVVAPDIQRELGGWDIPRAAPKKNTAEDTINKMLAGGQELNRKLTHLEEGLEKDRSELHLTPANLQRVVATALEMDHQPPLKDAGSEVNDAPVFEVPVLEPRWSRTVEALATRLNPGLQRKITFDAEGAKEDKDLVHVHLGHPLVQRSSRILRSEMWNPDARISRVSAVVVEGLKESFISAASRLVLVGKGGLRLHEEVFFAATRLNRRQAIAEGDVEKLLANALDAGRLVAAPGPHRIALAEIWNSEAESVSMKQRVQQIVDETAAKRADKVRGALDSRRIEDRKRVDEIFNRFKNTLQGTLTGLKEAEEDMNIPLWDDAEKRQREQDVLRIRVRLEALESEKDKEFATVERRYQDVNPQTLAAAVVFALTPEDAQLTVEQARQRWAK
jgi:superfamily II DNA or RNA helicase